MMKNRVLGSILIITGTAIGAGMLALPLVTAELGFPLATLLLILCWAVMTLTAFLVLHVNLAFHDSANFSTMAGRTLGRFGQGVTWLSFLLLLYALTAAYMTGGASLLQNTVLHLTGKQPSSHLSAFLFTLILGAFVYAGTRPVDLANRLLISVKALAFLLMAGLLFPDIQASNIFVFPDSHHAWLAALPILVTSFGFHTVIPSVRQYLHSDVKKLKQSIFIGSLIPLAIYLLWEVVILGIIPLKGPNGFNVLLANGGTLADLVNMIQNSLSGMHLILIVNVFTDVAITTSFLGVSLGLLHFVMDGFHLKTTSHRQRGWGALITYFPPLLFAWFYPKGFIMALNYASSFVVILLVIIPVLMTYRIEQKRLLSLYPYHLSKMVGGMLILFSLLIIAVEILPCILHYSSV